MDRFINQKELRAQFAEQLKSLDVKLDIDCTTLSELQDFYRRRAALDGEYAEGLMKLVNSSKQRHVNETARRPNLESYSSSSIWESLVGSTLRLSQVHSVISDVFTKQIVQRLIDMDEDAVRIHKQCRDMLISCQDRILSDLTKLQNDQREYVNKHTVLMEATRIKKRAEEKMVLVGDKVRGKGKDPKDSQRFLRAQNEYSTKYLNFTSANLATTRARNEYIFNMKAFNCGVKEFFSKEAPDIVDCLSCGFHNALARTTLMDLSCKESLKKCQISIIGMLNHTITGLDWRQDRTAFFKHNKNSFSSGSVRFVPAKEDSVSDISMDGVLLEQLENTVKELTTEINAIQHSIDRTLCTLDEIERKLLDLINQKDYDVSALFFQIDKSHKRSLAVSGNSSSEQAATSPMHQNSTSSTPHSAISRSRGSINHSHPDTANLPYLRIRAEKRDQRIEVERFYFERFANYTAQMHASHMLQSKLDHIRDMLDICPRSPISAAPDINIDPLVTTAATTPSNNLVSLPSSNSRIAPDGEDFSNTPPPPPAPDLTRRSVRRSSGFLFIQTKNENQHRPSSTSTERTSRSNRRVLQVPNVGKPRLFGSTLEDYVNATDEAIPCVVRSCVEIIAKYGLLQRGIFRVPGSQTEINEYKKKFDHGQDPLIDTSQPRDMNSTAGLLKLYFRELGEPPVPFAMFSKLTTCVRDHPNPVDAAHALAAVITHELSKPVFITLRYLFAFLNHVSEHAASNSMDAYNLAICFGPSILPVPDQLDQVNQQTVMIDIVKLMIQYHSVVFDPSVSGPVYDKEKLGETTQSLRTSHSEADSVDRVQSPSQVGMMDSTHTGYSALSSPTKRQNVDVFPDEDRALEESSSYEDLLDDQTSVSECEVSEPVCQLVVARADFIGSSSRELSFRQGDELFLYVRRNEHWWEGQLVGDTSGTHGLVPHIYVVPKIKTCSLDQSQLIEEEEEGEEEEEQDKLLDDSSKDNQVGNTNITISSTPGESAGDGPTNSLSSSTSTHLSHSRSLAEANKQSPTSVQRSHSNTDCKSVPVNQLSFEGDCKSENPALNPSNVSAATEPPQVTSTNHVSAEVDQMESTQTAVDEKLHEVLKSLNTLEQSDTSLDAMEDLRNTQEISKTFQLPSRHTPDLVMDLPDTTLSPKLPARFAPSGPEDKSSADNFASDSVSTVRKRLEGIVENPKSETRVTYKDIPPSKVFSSSAAPANASKAASSVIEPDSTTGNKSKKSIAARVAAFESSSSKDSPSMSPKSRNR